MTQAVHFGASWGLAFLTLLAAQWLLSLYYQLIESDLKLESLGKEALVAAFASLIQGVGLWLVFSVLHGGSSFLLFPWVVVFTIYRLHHLADWNGYIPVVILLLQLVIGYCGMMLYARHFGSALMAGTALVAGLGMLVLLIRSQW